MVAGDRNVAHAGVGVGASPLSFDRAPPARRPRALRRKRERQRSGRSDARPDLLSAVPVQRRAPGDRECARRHRIRRLLLRADAGRRVNRFSVVDPARRRDARLRRGSAIRVARLHGGSRSALDPGAGEREPCASRLLHAVPRRLERRAVGRLVRATADRRRRSHPADSARRADRE